MLHIACTNCDYKTDKITCFYIFIIYETVNVYNYGNFSKYVKLHV